MSISPTNPRFPSFFGFHIKALPFANVSGSSLAVSKRDCGRLASRRARYLRLAHVGLPALPLAASNGLNGLEGDKPSPPKPRTERSGASFSLAGQLTDRFMANA